MEECEIPLASCDMAELGDQILKYRDRTRPSIALKEYFEARLKSHLSIDLNALRGSIPYDLSKPLPPELYGKFDVVTNFGTSEHVSDQYRVLWNIHQLCRVGGLMYHTIPWLTPRWKGHCTFFYSIAFLEALAEINNYEVLKIEIPPQDSRLIHTAFRKKEEEWHLPLKKLVFEAAIL